VNQKVYTNELLLT